MCVWALTNPGPVMAWPSSSPWLRTRSSPRLPRRRSAYLPHRHVLRGRRILHGKPGAAPAVEARERRRPRGRGGHEPDFAQALGAERALGLVHLHEPDVHLGHVLRAERAQLVEL